VKKLYILQNCSISNKGYIELSGILIESKDKQNTEKGIYFANDRLQNKVHKNAFKFSTVEDNNV